MEKGMLSLLSNQYTNLSTHLSILNQILIIKNVCLSVCVSRPVTPERLGWFWWNFVCVLSTHRGWQENYKKYSRCFEKKIFQNFREFFSSWRRPKGADRRVTLTSETPKNIPIDPPTEPINSAKVITSTSSCTNLDLNQNSISISV